MRRSSMARAQHPYQSAQAQAGHRPITGPTFTGTPLPSRTSERQLVFIGDRPAQICALVIDAPLTYTLDRASTFDVQKLVEKYVDYIAMRPNILVEQRKILLSTGLTWSPKYDGMVAKQLNTLLREAFIMPKVYVLGVSARLMTAHDLNTRIERQALGTQLRRRYVRCIGAFDASVEYPAQPNTVEALKIVEAVLADPTI